ASIVPSETKSTTPADAAGRFGGCRTKGRTGCEGRSVMMAKGRAQERGTPRTPHYRACRCRCWEDGGGFNIEAGIGGQKIGWAGSVGAGQCSLTHLVTSSIRGRGPR